MKLSRVCGHKRTSQGGGGAAAPPENYFSGKTAKIYVISKRFLGKMFGQTGFLPPQVRKFFGQKENFFPANRCRPPSYVVPVRLCLQGTLKIVDDVLVMAPTLSILVERVRGVLSRFRKFNITASLKKFQMGTEVTFAGHCISGEGVKPNPDTLKAISGFEPPSNLTELRSFLGLANQLANFVPDLAHMTDSLRRLLKKKVIFQWLPEHQSDFEKIKELLTSSAVVGFFDSTWRTELLTDASKTKGLGFALMQRHPETGETKLIQCGSRSLTPAGENYATVELEAKVIQYGVIKCKHYLLGCPIFKVVTDHRPLVSVLKKYLDDTMNSRILKIREKLACFNFDGSWVPGKQHNIADALSRAPVFLPVEESEEDEDEVKVHVRMVLGSDLRLAKLAKIASEDPEYSQILAVLKSGLSLSSLDKSHPAYMLKSVWSNLSTLDDALIILDGTRIFLPRAGKKF